MKNVDRTPEELAEMEGSIDDLKKVESEGFEGHNKGGADIKFVSKDEQERRKQEAITEVDKNFAEFIKNNLKLVADSKKLTDIWMGDKQTSTYPPRYLQNNIARAVTQAPGMAQAYFERQTGNAFLVCYIDSQGNLYRIDLNLAEIPGAEGEIAKLGIHPFQFLEKHFRNLGCDPNKIGQASPFLGHTNLKLEKMFSDLESVK